MGTRDFRATKYNIYEATLLAPNGAGIRVDANGSASVRACLTEEGVAFQALLAPPPAQLTKTNHLSGTFSIRLLAGQNRELQR